jgi:hypothetical protein
MTVRHLYIWPNIASLGFRLLEPPSPPRQHLCMYLTAIRKATCGADYSLASNSANQAAHTPDFAITKEAALDHLSTCARLVKYIELIAGGQPRPIPSLCSQVLRKPRTAASCPMQANWRPGAPRQWREATALPLIKRGSGTPSSCSGPAWAAVAAYIESISSSTTERPASQPSRHFGGNRSASP